ncbi:MAG TPA: hypothetical protein VHM90_17210, partial [Phycisphaerae bacterium]|nr:hypothetical protein [Phycisphaerae bacterium]
MSQSNQNSVTRETCCLEPMESRKLLAAHFGLDAALDTLARNQPRLAIQAAARHESALSRGISVMSVQPSANPDAQSSLEPRLILSDGEIAVLFPQPGAGAVAIFVSSGELTYFNNGGLSDQAPWTGRWDQSPSSGGYGEARGYHRPAPRSANGSRPSPRDNSDSDSSSDPSARSASYDASANAPSASTTVNAAASGASGAVARSIFSTEPVNAQTTTTPVRAAPIALAAASGVTSFQSLWAGRAVRVYASVLPQELAPAAVEVQGMVGAVRVMADAPAAAADLAVSAAVHALPAPRQVLQFASIGSPFML